MPRPRSDQRPDELAMIRDLEKHPVWRLFYKELMEQLQTEEAAHQEFALHLDLKVDQKGRPIDPVKTTIKFGGRVEVLRELVGWLHSRKQKLNLSLKIDPKNKVGFSLFRGINLMTEGTPFEEPLAEGIPPAEEPIQAHPLRKEPNPEGTPAETGA